MEKGQASVRAAYSRTFAWELRRTEIFLFESAVTH
jgi:hypothetical protein